MPRPVPYHLPLVCNHGTDQSDRRMNVAIFCDLTCTLELWTETCFASTESADSSHVRLQISALGLIFAISHGWKFLSFFRAKKLSLRVLFFRAFPVWVEYWFHDDKHNLSWWPGQFDCISAHHGSPRACGPRAAMACRDLAILPRQPGEIVYVLHHQAHKAAACSAEAEVDSSNNGELGLYPDPRHDNRVRLIPLCGKPACQAFLVRGILSMEDGICGTNEWCRWAAYVPAGARILPLPCFCCLPGDGIPRWSLVTGRIGIYDAVIKQCHPGGYPPRHHERNSRPEVRVGRCDHRQERDEHRLNMYNDSSPCEICQLCVVVRSDVIAPALDQSTLGAIKGMLESEGYPTSITERGQTTLVDVHTVWPVDLETGSRLGCSPPVAVERRSAIPTCCP